MLQAVGAFLVGNLTLMRSISTLSSASHRFPTLGFILDHKRTLSAAIVSIYLSYGAGMVMNDIVDIDIDKKYAHKKESDSHNDVQLKSLHINTPQAKSKRPIASGKITPKAAWTYCSVLSMVSLILASAISNQYTIWTSGNLFLMISYALFFQKVLVVKNAICGWLAISPLIGAWIAFANMSFGNALKTHAATVQLWSLAKVGFLMHISREIVKDIEDIELDRGQKLTLPLVFGEKVAHAIAYGIVFVTFALNIFTPTYRHIFSSCIPVYPLSLAVTLPMCIRASMLDISVGQKLLKKSIYILLVGMIGALLLPN